MIERLQEALAGTYRIERELAGGGMSRLFLGTDVALGRPIVVKVLPPDFASEFSASRFRREIEVAAHLQHPHIVPILTAGVAGDLLYYVMPFVEGESLRQRLQREQRLPIADATRILSEVADALGYAHRQGIVHRDVKPENILLQEGHAVLADFGVARALAASLPGERLTSTGMALGTPGYMAPEQSVGDPNLDARADLYALGVVGYEMLGGTAPFTGASPQAVLAAHLTSAPRDLRDLRPEVPRQLAEAIRRALAKLPDDRFPSAPAFRAALDAGVPSRAPMSRWRLLIVAGVAAAVVGALALWWSMRGSAAPTLDRNVLAVAPFDIVGGDLALWREGLMDILSRNLDGAGTLRTVPPTVIVRRWSGRADAASARRLGERTGAALALYGALTRSGRDSVRLEVRLLDVAANRQLADVDVRDLADRVDRLADSASIAVLRDLANYRDVGASRLVSLGSRSLPAIRAFLTGEQYYRRGVMDSARAEYERAIALDTAFGPAYSRLGSVLGWLRGSIDQQAVAARLKAGAFRRGLGPRDSLRLLADSLTAASTLADADTAQWRFSRRALATLEEAARRYPDDPQVWYDLAEGKLHGAPGAGAPPTELLAAFEHALTQDSLFAPAYIHAVELAVITGDTAKARRLAKPYLAMSHRGPEASHIATLMSWLDRGTRDLDTLLLTFDASHLINSPLPYYPDGTESGVGAARLYLARALAAYPPAVAHARVHLAAAFAVRGHLDSAVAVGVPNATFVSEVALLEAYPNDSLAAVFAGWLRTSPGDARLALPWWSGRGDTASIGTYLRSAEAAQRKATSELERAMAEQQVAEARMFLALARGDSAAAGRHAASMRDTLCMRGCDAIRIARGRLLAQMGRLDEALRVLTPQYRPLISSLVPLFALERARVAERKGDVARAVQEYGYVSDLWRTPDPRLKSLVVEARSALGRLGRSTDAPRKQEVLPPTRRP